MGSSDSLAANTCSSHNAVVMNRANESERLLRVCAPCFQRVFKTDNATSNTIALGDSAHEATSHLGGRKAAGLCVYATNCLQDMARGPPFRLAVTSVASPLNFQPPSLDVRAFRHDGPIAYATTLTLRASLPRKARRILVQATARLRAGVELRSSNRFIQCIGVSVLY